MVTCIEIARSDIQKNEEVFSKILEDMIWSIGYQEYLQKEEDGDERIENVRALFEDIRHFFGVTRERIRQIEEKAIKKIKASQFNSCLKDFWQYLDK